MARKSLRYIWVYAGEGKDRDCIGRLSFTRSEYAALLAGGSSVDLGKEMMAAMDHDRPIIGSLCHAIDYVKATQENWTRNKPEWVDPGVKIGNYILDSLWRHRLSPTAICMAVGLSLWTFSVSHVSASIPMSFSAAVSASAAGSNLARSDGCKWISTFDAQTRATHGLSPWCTPSCRSRFQSSCTHPAAQSAGASDQTKFACSPLPCPKPISKWVPANGVSRLLIVSLFSSDINLGRLSSLNSSSAFAARLVALVTLSSDLRFSSLSRLNAIIANIISPATPSATNVFATTEPHRSQGESYEGWDQAITASAKTAATTAPPQTQVHVSHTSPENSNASSLALVIPFGRRHANGISIAHRLFALLIGITLVAFSFGLLFLAIHFGLLR